MQFLWFWFNYLFYFSAYFKMLYIRNIFVAVIIHYGNTDSYVAVCAFDCTVFQAKVKVFIEGKRLVSRKVTNCR